MKGTHTLKGLKTLDHELMSLDPVDSTIVYPLKTRVCAVTERPKQNTGLNFSEAGLDQDPLLILAWMTANGNKGFR